MARVHRLLDELDTKNRKGYTHLKKEMVNIIERSTTRPGSRLESPKAEVVKESKENAGDVTQNMKLLC